ncbi:MAG: hypothetical protein IKH75_11010 [Ruminococcus sp.]|nr:hypothetical protein [Ruminococcus sp.]
MTYYEMNSFILNYLKNDITGRAIMLTGEWGSGKSYYVKNTLKSFLEDKDNGKHKCVIVSLYGLSDISEISKAIYMELRTIKKAPSSETASTAKAVGKIVGKTIFNGLVSKIGFDIGGISDDDLQEVYESVDLTDKLIVLEDIERTQIDIIELLGYINNMCENDGVKVLLVTNESELLQYHIEIKEKNNPQVGISAPKKIYTEKAQNYLKAKEKTVSNTIIFNADPKETIDSIIDLFENNDLKQFKGELHTSRRMNEEKDITNYREVIVACQKACDLFDFIGKHGVAPDIEFQRCIYIGLINYLQKRLDDHDLVFNKYSDFDSNLSGNDVYPLMRFCYEYYNFQRKDITTILKAMDDYKKYKLYIKNVGYEDSDLKVLDTLNIHSENEINIAIENINNRLDNIDDIGFSNYGRIVNLLLLLKYDIHLENNKIDVIIQKVLDNLKGRGTAFTNKNYFFTRTYMIHDPVGASEFEKLKKEIFDALEYVPEEPIATDLSSYIENLDKISNKKVRDLDPNKLLTIIPLDNIVSFIPKFHPKTLDNLRIILIEIDYSKLSDGAFGSILQLKHGIVDLLDNNETQLDCMQKHQLEVICNIIDKNIEIGSN